MYSTLNLLLLNVYFLRQLIAQYFIFAAVQVVFKNICNLYVHIMQAQLVKNLYNICKTDLLELWDK